MLRHQPRAGHPGRRLDGRLRGRPAAQVRVPPLHRARRRDRRPPTTPPRCTRCSPAGSAAASARRPRTRAERDAATAGADGDSTRGRRPPGAVRLPPQPRRRRRRAAPGQRRRAAPWRTAGSSTSRWSGWPSGSRRSGCPGEEHPVVLPRTSEGLYLLQRLRDEAHRFAITFHRQRRSKAMTDQPARRHPRAGGEAAQGAAQALRVGQADPRRPRSTSSPTCRASGLRWRRSLRHSWARAPTARRRSTSPPVRSSTTKERAVPMERAVADDEPGGGGLPPVPRSTDFVIVTGMSGAGRSTAANVIEDRGWYVVDNLPPAAALGDGRARRPGARHRRQRPADRRRRRRARPRPSTPSCRPGSPPCARRAGTRT